MVKSTGGVVEARVTSRVENESLLNDGDGEQHASTRPSKRHFIPLKVSCVYSRLRG